ncbi:hypothetical protein FGI60_25970, partial [Brucella haematophila]|uniref:hypothetical protein n=2 Tax=Brucella haematophila TaxID=419474 RepID=UPI001AEE8D21
MTIPEQAVQAMPERVFLGCADTDNEHQVWTDEDEGGTEYVRADLAAPHLAAVRVNVDALAQEIRRVDGNHDKGAAALAEALMPFLSALEPSPCEELMKQIRDGTAYGFLNDGSQPEGNPDLDCPYCCGSGHRGDVEPSAGRAAVLEEAAQVAEERAKHTTGCNPYYVAIGIAAAIRALHPVADKPSDDGAQGEGWMPIESAPKDGTHILAILYRDACSDMDDIHRASFSEV